MPGGDEDKQKRWAAAAAKAYMTPGMMHALNMSKQQSQNKYKEQFDKSKGRGYTAVTSTPELERVKRQSDLVSQNKYKSEFEKNKAKFTQVADDPETVRVSRVSNQISDIAYHGKGAAISQSRRNKNREGVAARNVESQSNRNGSQANKSDEAAVIDVMKHELNEPRDKKDEPMTSESAVEEPTNGEDRMEELASHENEATSELSKACHKGNEIPLEESERDERYEHVHENQPSQEKTEENNEETDEAYQRACDKEVKPSQQPSYEKEVPPHKPRDVDVEESPEQASYGDGDDGGNLDDFYANLQ